MCSGRRLYPPSLSPLLNMNYYPTVDIIVEEKGLCSDVCDDYILLGCKLEKSAQDVYFFVKPFPLSQYRH